ncbi:MAG: AbrB/MazE/SpoVT family DNA-binding domain-containing protein [Sulfuriferula sp.]|nr:AbrB/MazE/SpoVT family DNA-binding domain-containing protein [Sulfuriferula sp.]
MHTTNLRKVGGSVMLVVPPAFLEQLHLKAGESVGVGVVDGRLIIEPKPKPRYTLAELLAISDYPLTQTAEENEWVNAPPAGGELL